MPMRTPAERFEDLPDFPYDAEFVSVGEPEMAYVDVGSGPETFLLLHGEPTWGFLYRSLIPTLREEGRVVVPDLIGFGRSEKYPSRDAYTFSRHFDWLEAFLEEVDLDGVTLVGQDWGGVLGLPLATQHEERFDRLVALNTGVPDGTQGMPDIWHQTREMVETAEPLDVGYMVDQGCATELSEAVRAAYTAPFHVPEAKAGVRAMMGLVPLSPDDDGAALGRETRERLARWFVLFSDSDPILSGNRDPLRELIPTASEQPDVWIEGASHFLQEDAGEEIAEEIVGFVRRSR
ncbi:MAG: haloalkane dehalogenase [Halodesulfurarchaeum sp.]